LLQYFSGKTRDPHGLFFRRCSLQIARIYYRYTQGSTLVGMKSLVIGTTQLSFPFILAPLAGISDLPFRMLNRRFGCEFAFTEMVTARALVYFNETTQRLLATHPQDRPLGIQLLGNDSGVLRDAVDLLKSYNYTCIDFNAACPVKKVTKRGEGASLLKAPGKIYDLLKVMVEASDVPVTVKIRAGWDTRSINAPKVALYAQDAGVGAVTVHGRTRSQGYEGSVDYGVIRSVKEALDIPVIGSGDAFSPRLIKKMLDETGCDGVAVARGAMGNPWLFNNTIEFLARGSSPGQPTLEELTATMITHLDLCCDFYGEQSGTMLFRKFFGWYTKGFLGIRKLRKEAFSTKSKDTLTAVIHQLRSERRNPCLPGCISISSV